MGVRQVGVGLLLSVLLAGCAADGDSVRTTPASSSGTPSVSATATSSPPSSSESSAPTTPSTSPSGPEGGIPADLVLPDQAEGRVKPKPDVGRLYEYICLDPPPWMNSPESLDARTVIFDNRTGVKAITIERLVAYRSAAQATQAVRGLTAQVDLCGDSADHVGMPSTWRASEVTGSPTADRALRLTYRTEGVVGTVITLVRVGRAVFYVDRRQDFADGVAQDGRTVAEFVPTLAADFR